MIANPVAPANAPVIPANITVVPAKAGTQHPIRRPDWERQLTAAIEHTPAFAWGEADCCTFAARIVLAMTGHDLLATFRGRYHTCRGALRFVQEGGGLVKLISDRLGDPLPSVSLAQRGDIVLATTVGGEQTVGICAGARIAAQGLQGVVFLPLSAGSTAWRV